ncbi:hypothetical protein ACFWU3_22700 [Streptomyces sp. NPDC058685]|uniref:hypothetical protein n=1 Tax=Streptomyces sp. NPDC058685 TaxID=3346598 RepID=UPI00364F687C
MGEGGAWLVLAGALVGSVVTGLVGWFGPLRLQRRQAASTATQYERVHHHEVRLEELRISSALELQRLQSEHARELEVARVVQARVERIVALRLVGGFWMQAIVASFNRLEAGEQLEPAAFDEEFGKLRREADEAAASLLVDGLWVASADDTSGLTQPLFEAMARATLLLRSVVVGRSRTGVVVDPIPPEVREAVREAQSARERFRSSLIELLSVSGAGLRRRL